jgi:hypothetical protein
MVKDSHSSPDSQMPGPPSSPPKRSGALSPFHEAKRSRPRFAKWGLAHFSAQKAVFVPDLIR